MFFLNQADFAIDMPTYLFLRFDETGPHGPRTYSDHMLPEVVQKDWRTGAQVMF